MKILNTVISEKLQHTQQVLEGLPIFLALVGGVIIGLILRSFF